MTLVLEFLVEIGHPTNWHFSRRISVLFIPDTLSVSMPLRWYLCPISVAFLLGSCMLRSFCTIEVVRSGGGKEVEGFSRKSKRPALWSPTWRPEVDPHNWYLSLKPADLERPSLQQLGIPRAVLHNKHYYYFLSETTDANSQFVAKTWRLVIYLLRTPSVDRVGPGAQRRRGKRKSASRVRTWLLGLWTPIPAWLTQELLPCPCR